MPPLPAECQAIADELDSLEQQIAQLENDIEHCEDRHRSGQLKRQKTLLEKERDEKELALAECQAKYEPKPQPDRFIREYKLFFDDARWYGNLSPHPSIALVIFGEGFGSAQGKVHIAPLPGQDTGALWHPAMSYMHIQSWSDTRIEAKLWDADYFPFEAEFYVELTDLQGQVQQSNKHRISVDPIYQSKYIEFCDPYVEAHQPTVYTGTPDDSWEPLPGGDGIKVIHRAGLLVGHKNDDMFFRGLTLKNHFEVAYVFLEKLKADPGEADADVVESHLGTNNPFVKVHWWNSPSHDHVIYTLSIILEGPRGYDYK